MNPPNPLSEGSSPKPDPTRSEQPKNTAIPSSTEAEGLALSLEEALARLEAIVRHLEEGQLSLDESLAQYEEGVRLLRHCYQLLEKAERRIELLAGVDAQGNPVLQPFEDRPLTLEEKAQIRDLHRTAQMPSSPPTTPPSEG
ncbi:MAG: exodeoxyribonuclease VII small subunit [Thermoguttaceae bacterium]|nr:exodeoxyribonuclease VII small subunit [Thermoguttaceae bacterium]MDW8038896.1 exodeoxyribonuclease VII small subunit [Thermoguttaceae bacterium]